jgi:hypothetical protein
MVRRRMRRTTTKTKGVGRELDALHLQREVREL